MPLALIPFSLAWLEVCDLAATTSDSVMRVPCTRAAPLDIITMLRMLPLGRPLLLPVFFVAQSPCLLQLVIAMTASGRAVVARVSPSQMGLALLTPPVVATVRPLVR